MGILARVIFRICQKELTFGEEIGAGVEWMVNNWPKMSRDRGTWKGPARHSVGEFAGLDTVLLIKVLSRRIMTQHTKPYV
jgi:hypothetical protein